MILEAKTGRTDGTPRASLWMAGTVLLPFVPVSKEVELGPFLLVELNHLHLLQCNLERNVLRGPQEASVSNRKSPTNTPPSTLLLRKDRVYVEADLQLGDYLTLKIC